MRGTGHTWGRWSLASYRGLHPRATPGEIEGQPEERLNGRHLASTRQVELKVPKTNRRVPGRKNRDALTGTATARGGQHTTGLDAATPVWGAVSASSGSGGWSAGGLPNRWRRASRNLARKILERAFTGSKKFFLAGSQICPSAANPPAETR